MTRILLTGAGFSRNWGGWLANEVFEYLLGSEHVNDRLRSVLWEAKECQRGFEDVLADLQRAFETRFDPQTEEDLRNLTTATNTMFAEMSKGYEQTNYFDEPVVSSKRVSAFLAKFDAIYTLNQDTLIEQKYDGSLVRRHIRPGLKLANSTLAIRQSGFSLYTPEDPSNFTLPGGPLPYIKLHGSIDWIYDRDLLLILGGNKEENIRKHELLKWYHKLFRDDLQKQSTRLMIIGYSFNDHHINKEILDAVSCSDLRLFIIDPKGVDVLDKRDQKTVDRYSVRIPPEDLLAQLSLHVIGASRRPLTTTFGNDLVEHAKVMKFFR